ncbi:hypothetical protein C359_02159 [Cryptococcus neoformans Bt120]|nr:hypothetical protein C359_02159 [Cryptococcus neoformans var. grubii Bt120]
MGRSGVMPSKSPTVWKFELEKTLQACTHDYRDLALEQAQVLVEPPSALATLRMIHHSHPYLINGFSPLEKETASLFDWSRAETYKEISGSRRVTVAVTDDGLADSVRERHDGRKTFVKALETKMTMSQLTEKLGRSTDQDPFIYYLQSQDGNIYRDQPSPLGPPELEAFQKYFKRDVPWMKEAIGKQAEAVNLWIGDSRSTTSLHHDPYENIYHVLAGSKTFILLSPLETIHLDQRFYPPSTLKRSPSGQLYPEYDYPDPSSGPRIPWVENLCLPRSARSLSITLQEGDTLFLPAGWWHRVEQEGGEEGIAVAVNYWYPSEIHPERYAYERFFRRIAIMSGMEGLIPPMGDEESINSEESDDPDRYSASNE